MPTRGESTTTAPSLAASASPSGSKNIMMFMAIIGHVQNTFLLACGLSRLCVTFGQVVLLICIGVCASLSTLCNSKFVAKPGTNLMAHGSMCQITFGLINPPLTPRRMLMTPISAKCVLIGTQRHV